MSAHVENTGGDQIATQDNRAKRLNFLPYLIMLVLLDIPSELMMVSIACYHLQGNHIGISSKSSHRVRGSSLLCRAVLYLVQDTEHLVLCISLIGQHKFVVIKASVLEVVTGMLSCALRNDKHSTKCICLRNSSILFCTELIRSACAD